MPEFITMLGPDNIRLAEASHILIPGRGRQNRGTELTPGSEARVDLAADLYYSGQLNLDIGYVVASGYRSPADRDADLVRDPDGVPGEFLGIPEAVLMARRLEGHGLSWTEVRVEAHSIDTTTNFARAEAGGHFGKKDDRPVAIVAQEAHLERMPKYIAPKTLRRPYIGVVVPEKDPVPDRLAASLASRAILLGINPYTKDIVARTERRADTIWAGVLAVYCLKSVISGGMSVPRQYGTD